MSQIFTELGRQQAREALKRAGRPEASQTDSTSWPQWLLTHLTGESHALSEGESAPLLLRTEDEAGDERWVVVCGPGSPLRVNGVWVGTGARVLSHRDELQLAVGAPRIYFSAESLPAIAPYDGAAGAVCPRCQQSIAAGDAAVRCPDCGVWHHESAERELLCWTYAPHCALCPCETALDGELKWVPEAGGRHG